MENIDYQRARGLDRNVISKLVVCDWVQRKNNIIFIGPAGIGKSYIACALGQQACRQGFSVKYFRLTKLYEALQISRASGKHENFVNHIAKLDVIILDDLGIGQLNENNRIELLEILEDRNGLKSTIITSQLPINLWHAHIGDSTIADAILDRLLNGAYKIEFSDSDSLREKDPEKQISS